MKRSQKLLRGLFPCVFVLVAACTVLVPTDPNAFSVPPEAATKLRAGQSISLRNAYPTETIVMIYQGHWSTDLQKSTSTAMSMMERALTQRGIDVKPTADKLVTLRVTNVNAWMHGIMIAPQQSAKLQLEAVFGDGRSTDSIICSV